MNISATATVSLYPNYWLKSNGFSFEFTKIANMTTLYKIMQ